MYSVLDIAKFFLFRAEREEDVLTNMKLQKLAYYAQGFTLAVFDEPLFSEPVLAWEHGPVVRELYDEYSGYRSNSIDPPAPEGVPEFDKEIEKLLDDVWSVYGQYSAWSLRNLTHEEPPWKNTPPNGVIPHEAMREFFITQLEDV
jgi:uncharacterized phage-associated protein